MANNTQSTNNAKANNWLISEWSKTKKGDGIIFSIYRRAADNDSGKKWEYGKVYVPLRHVQDWDGDKAAAVIRDSRTAGAQNAIICIPVEHKHTPPKN